MGRKSILLYKASGVIRYDHSLQTMLNSASLWALVMLVYLVPVSMTRNAYSASQADEMFCREACGKA